MGFIKQVLALCLAMPFPLVFAIIVSVIESKLRKDPEDRKIVSSNGWVAFRVEMLILFFFLLIPFLDFWIRTPFDVDNKINLFILWAVYFALIALKKFMKYRF